MTGPSPLVTIAGGGTGGHVIPAIAIAEEIVRRGGAARFIGTANRLEAKLVPQAGFDIDFIEVKPLVAGGVIRTVRGLLSIPEALFRSWRLLRKQKPNVVIGVGGYVAGPVVLAARLMGIPAALLEQNAVVGLTNRILSKVVTRAFVAYDETASVFGKGVASVTGNPVRETVLAAAKEKREKKKNHRLNAPLRILVMGGSQGASAIDDRVPRALVGAKLVDAVGVVHQCCAAAEPAVQRAYAEAGFKAEVLPFIHDTAAAYSDCDLVIARAGATTVSELTAMGLPAILLPYPHHKDHQQARNAEPMRRAGAAVVLDEKRTTVEDLKQAVSELVGDKTRRERAAERSYRLGRRDATMRIVNGLFELAGGS